MAARLYDGVLRNDILLAIPFFTFMGLILERSGMAEDLLDTIGQVFGSVRGGLAFAVVFVGALLAATTGVVAASVISMGLISLPIMLRYGYDRSLASGVIAASGTLAQIIPPSLVLIVLADQLQADVGSMYAGAFVPGIVLAGLYASYVALKSVISPGVAPGLPPEAQRIKEDPDQAVSTGLFTGLMNFVAWPTILVGLAWVALTISGRNYGWVPYAGAAGLGALFAVLQVVTKGPARLGAYPRLNLLGLTVAAAAIGVLAMWNVDGLGGIDFVILTMSIAAAFAFLIAIGNRSRGFAGVLGMFAAMATTVVFFREFVPSLCMLTAKDYTQFNSTIDGIVRGLGSLFVGIATFLIVSRLAGGARGLRSSVLSKMTQEVTFVMVPPLALIFLVLGTIGIGLATPTEGGAMGAVGALALAAMKRYSEGNASRFNWSIIRQAAESTAKLSAFVIFILVGARIFSLTFYAVGGEKWVEHHLTSLPGGLYGFLIIINIAVFLLAFFLDFFELAFIVIPLILPAATKIFLNDPTALGIAKGFGLTAEHEIKQGMIIWFGIMLGVNMQTSFMHPPFGFALFYLRSVAPKNPFIDKITGRRMEPVTTGQIYWGAVPYVIIQLVMVALVMSLPGMTISTKKPPKPAVEAHQAVARQGLLALNYCPAPPPKPVSSPATTTTTQPELGLPPLDLNKPPQLGIPPATPPPPAPQQPALDLSKPPNLTTTPPSQPTAPRPTAPQIDLNQPPKLN
jgi:TRAP-type mannitol/chloroaromatic compound transport system permease large subunit